MGVISVVMGDIPLYSWLVYSMEKSMKINKHDDWRSPLFKATTIIVEDDSINDKYRIQSCPIFSLLDC